MSTTAATEIVNNTSTSSGSSAMATPVANSSSTGTPTSSAPPTSVSIITARFAYLSNEEFNQWDEYRTYFYDYKDDKSLGTRRKRAEIMEELTEE